MSIGDATSPPTETGEPETGSVDTSASDPATSDMTASMTSDDSSGGCAGGGTCGAIAPDGWIGPFALNTASPPNASQQCPQGWTDHGGAFLDLVAAPATCACNCVPAAATCTAEVTYYSDSGCTMAVEMGASSGMCDGLSTETDHSHVRAVGTPSGVGCTPAEQYVVPPTAWNEASVMCSPPELPVCDEGVCLPATPTGFEDRWCVMKDGEHACPAGPYSMQRLRHRSLMDTRTCTPCGCNVQGTATCPGPLREYQLACTIELDEIPMDGQCRLSFASAFSAWNVRLDGVAASFSCANNNPTPVGEAIPTDPVTLCCT